MLINIQELSRTSTYVALYKGKKVQFEYTHNIYDIKGDIEILSYGGRTTIPEGIEKEIHEAIEKIDFAQIHYLSLKS